MVTKVTKLMIVGGCILALAGCSKKSTTISTPGGTVEVTKDGSDQSNMKITTKEGTMEISAGKKVDLSSFGVAVYPGAAQKEEGASSYTMQNKEGGQSMQMVTLVSSDPMDKVAQFYKDQFKDKKANIMDMNSGSTKMTHIVYEDGKDVTTLMISDDKGKTQIVITKGSKGGNK